MVSGFHGILGILFLFQPLQHGCLLHQVVCPSGKAKEGSLEGGNEVCTQARKMVCVLATHMASSLGWIVTCSNSSFCVTSRNMAGQLGRAVVAPFFYQPSAERHSVGPRHPLVLWTGSARYREEASRWVEWRSEKRVAQNHQQYLCGQFRVLRSYL